MLNVEHLTVLSAEGRRLLDNVSLCLNRGERLCLTGKSGSGKTTLLRTIMGLPNTGTRIAGGDILLEGKSLLRCSRAERRALCGRTLGFIPQNAMTAFFPNVRIGKQLTETYRLLLDCGRAEAEAKAGEMLRLVNLEDTRRVMNAWPGQLSGGMLQRVAVSILLGIRPKYILADEPTGALDESNRDLLIKLLSDYRDAGILFISHDVKAIRALCETTCVLEDGRIIKRQSTEALFESPESPWTRQFVEAAQRAKEGEAHWKVLR